MYKGIVAFQFLHEPIYQKSTKTECFLPQLEAAL